MEKRFLRPLTIKQKKKLKQKPVDPKDESFVAKQNRDIIENAQYGVLYSQTTTTFKKDTARYSSIKKIMISLNILESFRRKESFINDSLHLGYLFYYFIAEKIISYHSIISR